MTRFFFVALASFLPLSGALRATVLDGVYTEAQAKRDEAATTANAAPATSRWSADGRSRSASPKSAEHFLETWRDDSLEPFERNRSMSDQNASQAGRRAWHFAR